MNEGTKERAKGGRQKREREGERRNLSPATDSRFVRFSVTGPWGAFKMDRAHLFPPALPSLHPGQGAYIMLKF